MQKHTTQHNPDGSTVITLPSGINIVVTNDNRLSINLSGVTTDVFDFDVKRDRDGIKSLDAITVDGAPLRRAIIKYHSRLPGEKDLQQVPRQTKSNQKTHSKHA